MLSFLIVLSSLQGSDSVRALLGAIALNSPKCLSISSRAVTLSQLSAEGYLLVHRTAIVQRVVGQIQLNRVGCTLVCVGEANGMVCFHE